jgi:hypothetical protein
MVNYQWELVMTTISSLTSSILQNALNQTTSTTSQSQSASSLDAELAQIFSASDNTTLSLGSSTSTPLTYSSTGKMTQTQAEQLVQAIDASVANTVSELFGSSSSDSSNSSTSTLFDLMGSSSTSTSNSSDLSSLLSAAYPSTSSASNPTQTILDAIASSQNTVTKTLSSL